MRTHYCGDVTEALLDQDVEICGWVHRRRDHGGVIFIDLRDREGRLQVVFDPDREAAFATADRARPEWVLRIAGRVRRRPEGTANDNLGSGQVEVLAHTIEVLNTAKTPPFQLDEADVGEDVRLRHRTIDLRRPAMQQHLITRARVTSFMHRFLDGYGFLDIETPMLTRATPEGARDFLVPSRLHAGSFYALPQSPQLFKQLLMMSGLDRYYQIVRCFRDEDLRRSSARVHAARCRGLVHGRGRDHGTHGGDGPRADARCRGRRSARGFPAHDLRRGHRALWH